MTLCDALDKDAEPMVVRERSGTRNLKPGDLLGCRILRVAQALVTQPDIEGDRQEGLVTHHGLHGRTGTRQGTS